ncbi:MAG: hypothetical protein IJY23_05040 [Clostridia bacterium]|nr:hypothetical protein [Clostridia bacterium]
MKLHDELYFEITAEGTKSEIEKFASFITSGELDDFFELSDDYLIFSDNYDYASGFEAVSVTVSNDDYGIEINSLNPEDFLDVLCSAGKNVTIHGHLFDVDDEEYNFVSDVGSASFINTEDIDFADELDQEARREEMSDDDYE